MAATTRSQSHLVCAIVTPDYLGQLLILGRSLAATMPGAAMRVGVLQDCAGRPGFQSHSDAYLSDLDSDADHRAIGLDDVDWENFDVALASIIYSTLEFATSIKPALLRSFLAQGWEHVTYLDPDIEIYRDFTHLLDHDCDVSLTPHLFSDIPRDGFTPSTQDILQAGFYNLGFCSVTSTAIAFLNWWSERLQFDCLVAPGRGHFTDQRILDLATLKARVQSLREPGINVAYWNLHERHLVERDDEWDVSFEGDRHPLYFFHFSGFRFERSPSLSVHASRRIVGSSLPRAFAARYDEKLHASDEARTALAFTLAGSRAGEPIPEAWRRCLREDVEVHVRAGHTLHEIHEDIYHWADPRPWATCATCGVDHENVALRARSLLAAWACHPALDGVPNAIGAFFRVEHHEVASSPMAQLSWAYEHLDEAVRGHERLLAHVQDSAARALRNAVSLRLVGYFSYSAGIGQIARWTLESLDGARRHAAIERVYVEGDSPEYLSALLCRANPIATANASALCFINADQWRYHASPRVDPSTQRVEAVWAWELEEIPREMYQLAASGGIHRIHALSHWSARAMAKVLPVPVERFTPFDPTLVESVARVPAGASPDPYLLTAFDAKSLLSRKNPEGVLALWNRVRADFPAMRLVIKATSLRDLAPASLLEAIDATPRVELIDEYLGDEQYLSLLRHCSAYVSLHRSEGLGLTPIEAALASLPVLYTDYGGLSEFLDQGFYPVSYEMTSVGASEHDLGPYDRLARWAEPDLDDAERQLRRALESASDDTSTSKLFLDRKKLEANLASALEEALSTCERLFEATRPEDPLVEAMIDAFEAPLATIESAPQTPSVSRLYLHVVSPFYYLYRHLHERTRLQVNLALLALRGRDDASGD